ncbi:MAG TPA: hypothetical protein VGL57_02450 [Solirubrobacteraceae bacterium]
MLVLDGLLLHRVGVNGQFGAELLGAGDLLRPWQGEKLSHTLPTTSGWRVLEPTRIAVLDKRFARQMVRYPQLAGQLVARALERSRNLAVNMAIVHHARVDVRIHILLWHLAGRWGHMRSDGVLLPLQLSHDLLANLTAADCPAVTSALCDLAKRNLVHSLYDSWLLIGEPPGELLEFAPLPQSLASIAFSEDPWPKPSVRRAVRGGWGGAEAQLWPRR